MAKGSYTGGSTVIGPGSGWFGKGGVTQKLLGKFRKKGSKKAREAAIARHTQALLIERYAQLAQALRDAGFDEKDVQKGIALQRAKDRAALRASKKTSADSEPQK